MKTIQITISVPEDFESINTLETYVNQTGQRIKQSLFSSMIESMIDKEKPLAKALQSCPACQKKTAS